MRIAPWLVAGLALGLSAHAQTPEKQLTARDMNRMILEMMQWRAEQRKPGHISERADELRPRRRDEPLRYMNITDEEVRQVQLISLKYLPRAMVNISPVVTNCPCEEGPNCSAQVYVVATTGEYSKGLQLSRLRNQWMVGVVQQWWLRRDALELAEPPEDADFLKRYRHAKALHELYAEFPRCVGDLEPAESTASTPKAEPKK